MFCVDTKKGAVIIVSMRTLAIVDVFLVAATHVTTCGCESTIMIPFVSDGKNV